MSASSVAGATTQECNLNHIPLFPVRYALTDEALVNASNGKGPGPVPVTINDVDNVTFELTRVRAGFINIYVEIGIGEGSDRENKWHVFYHSTQYGDENSSLPRLDTEKKKQGGTAYYFYKYEWDEGTPESAWSILTEDSSGNKVQSYPYPFVAIGTSTAWVAYSEERWPAHYFKRAQSDPAFRERLMTKVVITKTPQAEGKYAPLIDLPNLARSFDVNRTSASTYNFGNSIRHTPIKAQNWGYVANGPCARERGYTVLVNDATAAAQDLCAELTLTQHSRALLAQENAYPLTTGAIVKGLQEQEALRMNASTWLPWGETRPHIVEFDSVYSKLLDDDRAARDELTKKELALFDAWKSLIDQTEIGTSGDMLALHAEEFEKATDADKSEVAGYGLFDVSNLVGPFASCEHDLTITYFDAVLFEESGASGEGATRMKELIRKVGAAFGAATGFAQERDFFYLASWDLSVETFSARLNKRNGRYYFNGNLVGLHRSQVLTFTTESEARATMQRMYAEGHYAGRPVGSLPRSEAGNVVTTLQDGGYPTARKQAVYSIPTRQVSVAEAPPSDWYRRANQLSGSWGVSRSVGAGFAMATSSLALADAVSKWNEARSYNDVKDWMFHPAVVSIAALTDIYAQALEIRTVARTLVQSSAVAARLFGNMPGLRTVAVAQCASTGGASRFTRAFGSKATGLIIGAYFSSKDLSDGWNNSDNNLIISGGLGLTSTAISAYLVYGAVSGPVGWFMLAASALAAVGAAAYGYFKLNNYEIWVRNGFWGGDMEIDYWGKRREDIVGRIEQTISLAHPDLANYNTISTAYTEELKYFFEQTLAVAVTNDSAGDRAINIHCQGLQTAVNLNQLDLDVVLDGIFNGDVNGAKLIRHLTLGADYTLEFVKLGQAKVTIYESVFQRYVIAPHYELRGNFIRVGATFKHTDGKRPSGSGSFPYDKASL